MPHDNDIDRRGFLKFAGASAAAASVSVAGCLGGDGDDGEDPLGEDGEQDLEITVAQGQFASTLDPQDHNDTPTYNVLDQAYEPLLYRDAEGEIVEYLATDYERLGEQEVEFTLRDGVQFHSGDEMTAEDVAYSINRTVDDEVGIVSPQQDGLSGIEGAEASGDGTVAVTLEGPNPVVFENFASFGRILQQQWMEEREDETIREANGTGPYRLGEFEEDVRATFAAFDEYWDADNTGDVSQVTFEGAPESSTRVNSLLAGETYLITNVPPSETPRIEDEGGMRFESIASTRVIFLVMTNDRAPFDSQEFRQAMNYAVDVEGIIDELLEGFGDPISQPTLEGHTGHADDVEPYPYDPEQAQQLVEESGYAGEEITLHTPTGRYLADEEIARAAASQIDDLPNVSCDVEIRDFGDLAAEALDGDMSTSPGFFLIGWGNPTFDANYTLVPWFMPGQATRHFENDEVVELLEQSESELDEDAREQHLQDANRLLNEQAPWVFLHNQYSIYGVNDDLDWEARSDEDILAKHISGS